MPEALGKMPLALVRAEQLQRLFTGIAAKGKGRSAEFLRAVLRAAFRRALKRSRVAVNPVAGTEAVRFTRQTGNVLGAARDV